jgi:hypothetical protein
MHELGEQDRFRQCDDVFVRPIHFVGECEGTILNEQCQEIEKLAMKFLIFPTPVRLHTLNFRVKESFYVSLELGKDLLCFSAIMHEVNLHEFTKIINENDIVFITTNRDWGRTPDIRKNEL